MNRAKVNSESHLLVTTVGDLVAAVIDETLEAVQDEEKAYRVACLVVNNLLQLANNRPFLFGERCVRRVMHDA